MKLGMVDKIAKAVLYEGYMLYPYRPSAVKNRQRFNFGVVYPRPSTSIVNGESEPSSVQTECLAQAGEAATLEVRLRFLQLVDRRVCAVPAGLDELAPEQELRPVESLEVDRHLLQSWQEAVEQEISIAALDLNQVCSEPLQQTFSLPCGNQIEPIRDNSGKLTAAIVRSREELRSTVNVSAVQLREGLFRITVAASNTSRWEPRDAHTRDDVLMRSLVSAHFVLGIEHGEFVSLLDPPHEFRNDAAACHNSRLWPTLVGETGERDTLLCSPIILYDYPQVAPESPGDLFDGTEIDEILSLRILTMTEDEKREMRESDERARHILERTESLSPEQWMKLHGALRDLIPPREKAS